jgi:hypothetical protein
VFEPRVIEALTSNVRAYAGMCRSPAALATLYGLDGLIGSVSAAEPPPARSP